MVHFGTIFVLLSITIFSSCQDAPIVNTPLGAVLGTWQLSRKGSEFFSFRGIRYAKAPVGDLRFQPPVPVENWEGTYDATQDGPACLQPGREDTSEDCLYLNVYTRRKTEVENPRPVLLSIHGGGYVVNSGQSTIYGPDYLLDHDIVLVTFNYRLGTLGFLSTGDEYAPGNYGMKDQVEVIRWVQRNIKYFGGDPARVTLAGESAGAGSVGLHLLSPMSRGLFRAAITASGSAANDWAIDRNPLQTAKNVAAALDCPIDNSQDLMTCIRRLPANDVANVNSAIKGWHDFPGVVLSPVVEKEDDENERFLTKDPYQSLNEGDIAHVPLFVGTTKDEFLSQALPVVQNQQWLDDLSTNWNDIAPIMCEYGRNDTVSELVRSFYFGSVDTPITNDSFEALGKLLADSIITFGTVQSAQIISDKIPEPVYLYQFNYQGKNSGDYKPGTQEPYGVLHADDLIYLFYNENQFPFINITDEDGVMVDRFTTLYINFVETGNPTPEPSEILDNILWKPYKNEAPSYLDINRNLTVVEGLFYKERLSFWNELFPIENRISRH